MEQFYANANESGKIIGYYTDAVHEPEQIPDTAVPITAEQWQDSLANPRKYKIVDSELTEKSQEEIDQEIADELANQPPLPPTTEEEISQLKTDKAVLEQRLQASESAILFIMDFI
jgi:hypothetical protein